jgi:hypothetical protein
MNQEDLNTPEARAKLYGNSNPNFPEKRHEPVKTSVDYLNECKSIQEERGKQYDSEGTGERSFKACADAYNAITGSDLKGSDICLILQLLKDVRLYSNRSKPHEDSLLDKVSYASLHAEEINREYEND